MKVYVIFKDYGFNDQTIPLGVFSSIKLAIEAYTTHESLKGSDTYKEIVEYELDVFSDKPLDWWVGPHFENNPVILFLKDWLAWAESDPQNEITYNREIGLCVNIQNFTRDQELRKSVTEDLNILLLKDFPDNPIYPFGGEAVHMDDSAFKRTHKNPERLAWVRKTIKELEVR